MALTRRDLPWSEFGRSALRLEMALPADVVGPVALFHGCQRWIASACRARRSCVQPQGCGASFIDEPIVQKVCESDFATMRRSEDTSIISRS